MRYNAALIPNSPLQTVLNHLRTSEQDEESDPDDNDEETVTFQPLAHPLAHPVAPHLPLPASKLLASVAPSQVPPFVAASKLLASVGVEHFASNLDTKHGAYEPKQTSTPTAAMPAVATAGSAKATSSPIFVKTKTVTSSSSVAPMSPLPSVSG